MNDDTIIQQRVSGRSARAIARAQGCTLAEVSKVLDRFTETTIDDKTRKHTLALEFARLDELQETFYARAMEGDVGGRAHTGTVTEDGFEMRAGDFLGDLGERRIVFPGIWGARWPNRKGPRGGRPKRHAARFTAQPQEFAMIIAFRSAKVRSGVSLRPMAPHASRKGYLKLSLV